MNSLFDTFTTVPPLTRFKVLFHSCIVIKRICCRDSTWQWLHNHSQSITSCIIGCRNFFFAPIYLARPLSGVRGAELSQTEHYFRTPRYPTPITNKVCGWCGIVISALRTHQWFVASITPKRNTPNLEEVTVLFWTTHLETRDFSIIICTFFFGHSVRPTNNLFLPHYCIHPVVFLMFVQVFVFR
jgi:hypothetical protein